MTEEIIKCVKGESCIHCGSNYCRFVDEVNELEQENKELKKQIESDKGLITVGGKQQYDMTMAYDKCKMAYDKCKTALEEIREIAKDIIENDVYENSDVKAENILDKINEVLNG